MDPVDTSQFDEIVKSDETFELVKGIIKDFVAKSQLEIAIGIVLELKESGCFSRSSRQKFASELKVPGPRATVYRVVSVLEDLGILDRESKYSGYFLSHNFSNRLESCAEKWRRFSKGT